MPLLLVGLNIYVAMNKVILIGNVGNMPEVKTLENGSKVVNLNLATNERYTNKAGEKVEQTEWHRVEAWNGIAEAIEKYVQKGDRIFIEGKLNTQKWNDEQGTAKNATKIRAYMMEFLGYRREQIENQGNETVPKSTKSNNKPKEEPPQAEGKRVVYEDEMPF